MRSVMVTDLHGWIFRSKHFLLSTLRPSPSWSTKSDRTRERPPPSLTSNFMFCQLFVDRDYYIKMLLFDAVFYFQYFARNWTLKERHKFRLYLFFCAVINILQSFLNQFKTLCRQPSMIEQRWIVTKMTKLLFVGFGWFASVSQR